VRPPAPQQRFEAVYTAHYPAVLSYVRRRTASPDDTADAVAEIFATAWRRVDDLPAGDEARLWLYGVARRVLANQRRGEARRSALADRLRAELTVWADSHTDQDHGTIRSAFQRLTPDDRELLSLRSWEGLTTAEMAMVLGCSGGAVRLRLHRARKRLARELHSGGLDLARYGHRAAALMGGES
jgi:RNA polymerase sigma-70 factor (ECF subfamily)